MQISTERRLNPERIRLLNWNVMKQARPQLHTDLEGFSRNIDLALLQEVHMEGRGLQHFNDDWHRSFAPGFSLPGRTTGVMTLSNAGHRSHDRFRHSEPLLRTAKAANVTTYDMQDLNKQLLVLNLHAVNFSLGMKSYARQLNDLLDHICNHPGPVVFAGDFNAWHTQRCKLLEDIALQHGLSEVMFEEDRRTSVFGRHLDYIFVRDMAVQESRIHDSSASDHNPLLATLEYSP